MATETQAGQWITVANEWDESAEVFMVAGDRASGIGYCEGKPVFLFGGAIQAGPAKNEKIQWVDGAGRCWRVDERGQWIEFSGVTAGAAGWRCE